jgi:hypothetical protein
MVGIKLLYVVGTYSKKQNKKRKWASSGFLYALLAGKAFHDESGGETVSFFTSPSLLSPSLTLLLSLAFAYGTCIHPSTTSSLSFLEHFSPDTN